MQCFQSLVKYKYHRFCLVLFWTRTSCISIGVRTLQPRISTRHNSCCWQCQSSITAAVSKIMKLHNFVYVCQGCRSLWIQYVVWEYNRKQQDLFWRQLVLMVNDFVVFTNKVGVVPISWYIWIVITISYHKSFPFLVLKMGSPRIYSGAKTFNTKIIPSMWQDCITITSTQSKSGEFQGW